MGIHTFLNILKKVPTAEKNILLTNFKEKRVAFDAGILTQSLYSVAHKIVTNETNLYVEDPDKDKVIGQWIDLIVNHLLKWITSGVTPIVVFDGTPPPEKETHARQKRRDERRKKRIEYENMLYEARQMNSFDQSPSLLQELQLKCRALYFVEPEDVELMKRIIRNMGIPILQAKSEAEWLCTALYKEGYVSAVFSNDTDNYALGCQCLLTDFGPNHSDPSGNISYTIIMVDMIEILTHLDLSYSQFVDICILSGCDYNDRVGLILSLIHI